MKKEYIKSFVRYVVYHRNMMKTYYKPCIIEILDDMQKIPETMRWNSDLHNRMEIKTDEEIKWKEI